MNLELSSLGADTHLAGQTLAWAGLSPEALAVPASPTPRGSLWGTALGSAEASVEDRGILGSHLPRSKA